MEVSAVVASEPTAAASSAATPPAGPKVTRARKPRRRYVSTIPDDILNDPKLRSMLDVLPPNYNFEVAKTVWRIKQMGAKSVALQFPEGLLMYATHIADILEEVAGAEAVILGDVTYGACCVDDLSAAALGCELLVHYAHSCLVPIDRMALEVMYVFVEIEVDLAHLVDTVKLNFGADQKLALCGTIQVGRAVHAAAAALNGHFAAARVPQCKPLSAGEVLGCTAPPITDADLVVFVADGRFHPEAVMIANPTLPLYRYDPYAKAITRERYDHGRMRELRRDAVARASGAKRWGLVLGTLGRQGSPEILAHLQALLSEAGLPHTTYLLSEIFPQKLALMPEVDAWVQVCCPRLSIDWGHAFGAPVLTAYEAEVALGARAWEKTYPMDYYAKAGGSWANYAKPEERQATRDAMAARRCCGGADGGGGGATTVATATAAVGAASGRR